MRDPMARMHSKKRRRQFVLRVRVDAHEFATISHRAKTLGCALATYVRESALKPRRHEPPAERPRALVAKIGLIVETLERQREAGIHGTPDFDVIISALGSIVRDIIGGQVP